MQIEIQFTCGEWVTWRVQGYPFHGRVEYTKFKRNLRQRLVTYYGVKLYHGRIYEVTERRLKRIQITT